MNNYTYSEEETLAQVARVSWLHQIDVGHGIVTPGRNVAWPDVARLGLPDDMQGKRVLDVGAADGFFSFLCEERGAKVTAIDIIEGLPVSEGEHGFKIAAKLRSSQTEFREISVYQAHELDGEFNIVLLLNVLYHLKHPLYGLEQIYNKMADKGVLYLKTYFYEDIRLKNLRFDLSDRALCQFFESDELNHDITNWWAPNKRCLEAMLRSVGFKGIKMLAKHDNRIYYQARK